jgi:hypothetical protein
MFTDINQCGLKVRGKSVKYCVIQIDPINYQNNKGSLVVEFKYRYKNKRQQTKRITAPIRKKY